MGAVTRTLAELMRWQSDGKASGCQRSGNAAKNIMGDDAKASRLP